MSVIRRRALVLPGDRDVTVADVEHGVVRDEGSRVPVRPDPEMDDVDLRGEQGRVLRCGRVEIVGLDRHRAQPRGGGRRQRRLEVCQVAVVVSGRGEALVDLEELDSVPGKLGVHEQPERLPRAAASGQGDGPGAAADPPGEQLRESLCSGGRIGHDFELVKGHGLSFARGRSWPRTRQAPRPNRYARPVRFARRLVYLWLCNIVALWAAESLISGIDFTGNFGSLVIAALVFALVNLVLKPVAKLLAFPLIVLTLGIALFFVNILMLYVTDWLVPGFSIAHFGDAVWATIVIWGVNWVLQILFDVDDRKSRKGAS